MKGSMATGFARIAVLALLVVAGPAAPASPAPLAIRLAPIKGRAVATLDLAGVFAPGRYQEFGNGLTNLVEIYTSVVPANANAPMVLHGRIIEILFDVWEETYTVTVKDPEHPVGRTLSLPSLPALRSFLSDQRDIDLGPAEGLPEVFTVEVRVEVNPISREQLQRTREYIAAAASTRTSGSRSVLGAVASFLLREPDAGSDVHLFRSAPFTRGAVLSSGVPSR